MPTVEQFMQRSPATIHPEATLAIAHQLMRQTGARVLPVVAAGALVGVVSLHDLHLLETLSGVDPREATVDEAMTASPLCVEPAAPLAEVAHRMASRGASSAVVVTHDGRVVGLFTSQDALRALSGRPVAKVIELPIEGGWRRAAQGEAHDMLPAEVWPRRSTRELPAL